MKDQTEMKKASRSLRRSLRRSVRSVYVLQLEQRPKLPRIVHGGFSHCFFFSVESLVFRGDAHWKMRRKVEPDNQTSAVPSV